MSDRNERVADTVIQVLEEVSMIFGEPLSREEAEKPEEGALRVAIEFHGEGSGGMEMLWPQSLAREIAAGVLGVDADDPEAEENALDSLKELLNVSMGQVLTRLWGTEHIFDLTPPNAHPVEEDTEWEEWRKAPETIAILVEDHAVLLKLHVEDEERLEGSAA